MKQLAAASITAKAIYRNGYLLASIIKFSKCGWLKFYKLAALTREVCNIINRR